MPGRRPLVFVLVCLLAATESRPQGLVEPPAVEPAPHERLIGIEQQLDALRAQAILNAGQHMSLVTQVGLALAKLERGDGRTAVVHLSSLAGLVDSLSIAGVIGVKDAQAILGETGAAQASIELGRTLPAVLPVQGLCLPPEACEPLVLHVDSAAPVSLKADGSSVEPYRTIAQALQRAVTDLACSVEIILAPGAYHESIFVTRPLSLRGEGTPTPTILGSILNSGGHALHVSGVRLRGSPDPGAIVVDGVCPSTTELTQVEILSATRAGVFQRGGTLRAFALLVSDTRALADESHAGIGIRITDGAQAALGLVDSSQNDSGGLSVEGDGTRVYLTVSRVDDNRANPHFLPEVIGAGIKVDGGALLLTEYTSLARNEFEGLSVRGGAQAHFRYGSIEQTPELTVGQPPAVVALGGFNTASAEGGVLELSGFTVSHAFGGLWLDESYAALSHGTVRDHTWAVGYFPRDDFPAPSQFACFFERGVTFLRNEVIVEMPPFSPPPPCIGDCPPLPCVISVPFACTWCGAP